MERVSHYSEGTSQPLNGEEGPKVFGSLPWVRLNDKRFGPPVLQELVEVDEATQDGW